MVYIQRVIGSNPIFSTQAKVAQLVEHYLAKVRVASSNLVFRSIRDSGFKVKDTPARQ